VFSKNSGKTRKNLQRDMRYNGIRHRNRAKAKIPKHQKRELSFMKKRSDFKASDRIIKKKDGSKKRKRLKKARKYREKQIKKPFAKAFFESLEPFWDSFS
jgi:hypothetical protein